MLWKTLPFYGEDSHVAAEDNAYFFQSSEPILYFSFYMSSEMDTSRNTIIHKWNLGEGCQTFEGNSGI